MLLLDSYPVLVAKMAEVTVEADARSRTSSSASAIEPAAPGGAAGRYTGATPDAAATPPAAASSAAASSSSDSDELCWEEQVRVLAVAVAELHALVGQRRRNQQTDNRSSIAYAQMAPESAHALTSHLVLTASVLAQQVAAHWTGKHAGGAAPSARRGPEHVCHDPSPLLSVSASTGSACESCLSASGSSSAPPTPAASFSRKAVLPFSNIRVLETNILSARTAAGGKKKDGSGAGAVTDRPAGEAHPRDIALLSAHFAQLLSSGPPSSSSSSHAPSSSSSGGWAGLHPFGIMLSEFCRGWSHCASRAARAGVLVDRTFISSHLAALHAFLAAHESFVGAAYPHIASTTLARKVLRSTLRKQVLDNPSVLHPIQSWFTTAHSAEDRAFAEKVDQLRELTLSELGLAFPFTLSALPLVAMSSRGGEGVPGLGASSLPPSNGPGGVDDSDSGEEEAELDAAGGPDDDGGDRLIHDGAEDGAGEAERGTHQQKMRLSSRAGASATGTTRQRRTPSAVSIAAIARASSNNSLAFLSSTPRRPSAFGAPPAPSSAGTSPTFAAAPTPSLGLAGVVLPSTPGSSAPPSPLLRATSDHAVFRSLLPTSPVPPLTLSPLAQPDSFASNELPYAGAIHVLSGLDDHRTIDAKLACLVAVCRAITADFNAFLLSQELGRAYNLTCDELLQIFAFCLLHAECASPVASAMMLADLIEGSALGGEAGYALTTLQCAIALIQAFDPNEKQASAQNSPASLPRAIQIPPQSRESASVAQSLLLSSSFNKGVSIGPSSLLSSPSSSSLSSAPTTPKQQASPAAVAHAHDIALFAPMLAANLDAFCIAADFHQLDSGWVYVDEKKSVTVYKKTYHGSPVHSIKGVSVIHRPPHLLQGFLKPINNRVLVDELYIGGTVLLHLSPETRLVNYKFKARNWCSRQSTDMVLLLHQGVCTDGVTLVTLAFSVTHPCCPPQPGFARATVRASGWLFKPMNNGASTHCTYIVSPDTNGFPAWVVNLLSVKQPMVIANVRDVLETLPLEPKSSATTAPPSPALSHTSQPSLGSRRQSSAVASPK